MFVLPGFNGGMHCMYALIVHWRSAGLWCLWCWALMQHGFCAKSTGLGPLCSRQAEWFCCLRSTGVCIAEALDA
jgi:hypothetical protein